MNDVLKQRLVGALILVALGVVFWPIIFVEPGGQGGAGQTQIPPRPHVDTTPVEAPDMAGLRPSPAFDKDVSDATPAPEAGAPAADTATERADPAPEGVASGSALQPVADTGSGQTPARKTRAEPPVKPRLDADGIPITWILRVASVSSAARAEELRSELQKSGHKAYVKKVRSGGKLLYRVYVGPKAEKAKLEQIRGQIDSQFGVTSMITRYYP